jgi:hypothetical protein
MIVASTIVPARSVSRCSASRSFTASKIGQPVLLEEVTEAPDRRLVRDLVVAQLHAGEAPHRLAVVDRIFRLRIRQVEPLLQEVDPQHPLQVVRRTTLARVRMVRLDQLDQPRPRDHRIHLGQEPLPPRHLALPAPGRRRERLLLVHRVTPRPLFYHSRVTSAGLP